MRQKRQWREILAGCDPCYSAVQSIDDWSFLLRRFSDAFAAGWPISPISNDLPFATGATTKVFAVSVCDSDREKIGRGFGTTRAQ
jgi:hypothetical protein